MQKVLAQALDYVILKEWMPRNQNPTNCELAVLVPLEQHFRPSLLLVNSWTSFLRKRDTAPMRSRSMP